MRRKPHYSQFSGKTALLLSRLQKRAGKFADPDDNKLAFAFITQYGATGSFSHSQAQTIKALLEKPA